MNDAGTMILAYNRSRRGGLRRCHRSGVPGSDRVRMLGDTQSAFVGRVLSVSPGLALTATP